MSFLINPFAFAVAGGDFEPIATVTVGSGGASSIEFTSIPSTFAHLQIRAILRTTQSAYYSSAIIRLNGDSGSNYAQHNLIGQGSAAYANGGASATSINYGFISANTALTSNFAALVIDILDYESTSKTTTLRLFNGYENNGNGSSFNGGMCNLVSGLWTSTAAVSTFAFTPSGGLFAQHSTAALYGVKAP